MNISLDNDLKIDKLEKIFHSTHLSVQETVRLCPGSVVAAVMECLHV